MSAKYLYFFYFLATLWGCSKISEKPYTNLKTLDFKKAIYLVEITAIDSFYYDTIKVNIQENSITTNHQFTRSDSSNIEIFDIIEIDDSEPEDFQRTYLVHELDVEAPLYIDSSRGIGFLKRYDIHGKEFSVFHEYARKKGLKNTKIRSCFSNEFGMLLDERLFEKLTLIEIEGNENNHLIKDLIQAIRDDNPTL